MKRVFAPSLTLGCLLAGRYLSEMITWELIPRPFREWIDPVLVFESLIWLCVAWLAKRAIEVTFRRAWTGSNEERIPGIAFDILGVLLFLAAVIAIVGFVFGQPVTGLLATSGILTGVIAFAVRDLIADVFAGIALAIERPIRFGDWVQFDDGTPEKTGRVVEMNWRAVRMVTVQGRTIVFPNNALSRREFVNLSLPERFFRSVKKIVVDFNVPAERAADIIMSAIRATPGVVQSQKPLVLIDELSERGTLFSYHFWVPDYPDMFMIERQVVENVLHFLDQAGHGPSYPKLEADIAWHHVSEIDASMDVPDLLHRVPLFSELSEDERIRLANYAKEIRASAGETLVAEGKHGTSLFVVLTGLVSAYKSVNGERHSIGIVEPGKVFGEMAMLTDEPRSATIVAEVDSVLLEIKREALKKIVEDNPGIVEQLGRIQASRMDSYEIDPGTDGSDKAGGQGLASYLVRRIWQVFGESG
jgi:small-conductance mechanosensitive channel